MIGKQLIAKLRHCYCSICFDVFENFSLKLQEFELENQIKLIDNFDGTEEEPIVEKFRFFIKKIIDAQSEFKRIKFCRVCFLTIHSGCAPENILKEKFDFSFGENCSPIQTFICESCDFLHDPNKKTKTLIGCIECSETKEFRIALRNKKGNPISQLIHPLCAILSSSILVKNLNSFNFIKNENNSILKIQEEELSKCFFCHKKLKNAYSGCYFESCKKKCHIICFLRERTKFAVKNDLDIYDPILWQFDVEVNKFEENNIYLPYESKEQYISKKISNLYLNKEIFKGLQIFENISKLKQFTQNEFNNFQFECKKNFIIKCEEHKEEKENCFCKTKQKEINYVQCEGCFNWLHNKCIEQYDYSPNSPYFCPKCKFLYFNNEKEMKNFDFDKFEFITQTFNLNIFDKIHILKIIEKIVMEENDFDQFSKLKIIFGKVNSFNMYFAGIDKIVYIEIKNLFFKNLSKLEDKLYDFENISSKHIINKIEFIYVIFSVLDNLKNSIYYVESTKIFETTRNKLNVLKDFLMIIKNLNQNIYQNFFDFYSFLREISHFENLNESFKKYQSDFFQFFDVNLEHIQHQSFHFYLENKHIKFLDKSINNLEEFKKIEFIDILNKKEKIVHKIQIETDDERPLDINFIKDCYLIDKYDNMYSKFTSIFSLEFSNQIPFLNIIKSFLEKNSNLIFKYEISNKIKSKLDRSVYKNLKIKAFFDKLNFNYCKDNNFKAKIKDLLISIKNIEESILSEKLFIEKNTFILLNFFYITSKLINFNSNKIWYEDIFTSIKFLRKIKNNAISLLDNLKFGQNLKVFFEKNLDQIINQSVSNIRKIFSLTKYIFSKISNENWEMDLHIVNSIIVDLKNLSFLINRKKFLPKNIKKSFDLELICVLILKFEIEKNKKKELFEKMKIELIKLVEKGSMDIEFNSDLSLNFEKKQKILELFDDRNLIQNLINKVEEFDKSKFMIQESNLQSDSDPQNEEKIRKNFKIQFLQTLKFDDFFKDSIKNSIVESLLSNQKMNPLPFININLLGRNINASLIKLIVQKYFKEKSIFNSNSKKIRQEKKITITEYSKYKKEIKLYKNVNSNLLNLKSITFIEDLYNLSFKLRKMKIDYFLIHTFKFSSKYLSNEFYQIIDKNSSLKKKDYFGFFMSNDFSNLNFEPEKWRKYIEKLYSTLDLIDFSEINLTSFSSDSSLPQNRIKALIEKKGKIKEILDNLNLMSLVYKIENYKNKLKFSLKEIDLKKIKDFVNDYHFSYSNYMLNFAQKRTEQLHKIYNNLRYLLNTIHQESVCYQDDNQRKLRTAHNKVMNINEFLNKADPNNFFWLNAISFENTKKDFLRYRKRYKKIKKYNYLFPEKIQTIRSYLKSFEQLQSDLKKFCFSLKVDSACTRYVFDKIKTKYWEFRNRIISSPFFCNNVLTLISQLELVFVLFSIYKEPVKLHSLFGFEHLLKRIGYHELTFSVLGVNFKTEVEKFSNFLKRIELCLKTAQIGKFSRSDFEELKEMNFKESGIVIESDPENPLNQIIIEEINQVSDIANRIVRLLSINSGATNKIHIEDYSQELFLIFRQLKRKNRNDQIFKNQDFELKEELTKSLEKPILFWKKINLFQSRIQNKIYSQNFEKYSLNRFLIEKQLFEVKFYSEFYKPMVEEFLRKYSMFFLFKRSIMSKLFSRLIKEKEWLDYIPIFEKDDYFCQPNILKTIYIISDLKEKHWNNKNKMRIESKLKEQFDQKWNKEEGLVEELVTNYLNLFKSIKYSDLENPSQIEDKKIKDYMGQVQNKFIKSANLKLMMNHIQCQNFLFPEDHFYSLFLFSVFLFFEFKNESISFHFEEFRQFVNWLPPFIILLKKIDINLYEQIFSRKLKNDTSPKMRKIILILKFISLFISSLIHIHIDICIQIKKGVFNQAQEKETSDHSTKFQDILNVQALKEKIKYFDVISKIKEKLNRESIQEQNINLNSFLKMVSPINYNHIPMSETEKKEIISILNSKKEFFSQIIKTDKYFNNLRESNFAKEKIRLEKLMQNLKVSSSSLLYDEIQTDSSRMLLPKNYNQKNWNMIINPQKKKDVLIKTLSSVEEFKEKIKNKNIVFEIDPLMNLNKISEIELLSYQNYIFDFKKKELFEKIKNLLNSNKHVQNNFWNSQEKHLESIIISISQQTLISPLFIFHLTYFIKKSKNCQIILSELIERSLTLKKFQKKIKIFFENKAKQIKNKKIDDLCFELGLKINKPKNFFSHNSNENNFTKRNALCLKLFSPSKIEIIFEESVPPPPISVEFWFRGDLRLVSLFPIFSSFPQIKPKKYFQPFSLLKTKLKDSFISFIENPNDSLFYKMNKDQLKNELNKIDELLLPGWVYLKSNQIPEDIIMEMEKGMSFGANVGNDSMFYLAKPNYKETEKTLKDLWFSFGLRPFNNKDFSSIFFDNLFIFILVKKLPLNKLNCEERDEIVQRVFDKSPKNFEHLFSTSVNLTNNDEMALYQNLFINLNKHKEMSELEEKKKDEKFLKKRESVSLDNEINDENKKFFELENLVQKVEKTKLKEFFMNLQDEEMKKIIFNIALKFYGHENNPLI